MKCYLMGYYTYTKSGAILLSQSSQGLYKGFRVLGGVGCSVPSAARTLLRAPGTLNYVDLHWTNCLTYLELTQTSLQQLLAGTNKLEALEKRRKHDNSN